MILKFDFIYISDNDFFEYLLRYYTKGYDYNLIKSKNKYTLILKAEEKNMLEFCEKLKHIGNSVFLRQFDISEFNKEFEKDNETNLLNFNKKDFLTYLNANSYLQDNKLLHNEWNEFVNMQISFDNIDFIQIDQNNFDILLNKSINNLQNSKDIFIKDNHSIYKISIFDIKNQASFLMPTNIKAINSIFVCNNENLKLLASIEKPLIKLKFNAIFKHKHEIKDNYHKIRLAYNLFLFALTNKMYERSFIFLSFNKIKYFEDEFEIFEYENKLIQISGFDYINTKAKKMIFDKNDKNIARISYILSNCDENTLLLELSKDYDDILLIDKEKNLLNLDIAKNSIELYDILQEDDISKRLFDNFNKQFKLPNKNFDLKNSFFSLFCIIGNILGLDDNLKKAGEKLLVLSDESRLPRGVKIDFKFKQNNKEFDYIKTIKSTMSFMLAGVESANIAYGAVESLAFFLRDLYDELLEKQIVNNALITGSLFEHKSLLKNTLKLLKNSKISNVPLRI